MKKSTLDTSEEIPRENSGHTTICTFDSHIGIPVDDFESNVEPPSNEIMHDDAQGEIIHASVCLKVSNAFSVDNRGIDTSEASIVIDGRREDLFQLIAQSRSTKCILLVTLCLTIVSLLCMIVVISGVFENQEETSRHNYIQSIATEISGEDSFKIPNSPQSKALKWVLYEDQAQIPLNLKSRFVQRYVTAVLSFSYHEINLMDASKHECDWNIWENVSAKTEINKFFSPGYHCRDNQTISDIQLYYRNLTGTIASEVGHLSDLVTFNIGGNPYVRSTIPSEIGSLSSLSSFFAFDNDLYGTIPTQVPRATNLQLVMLYGNTDLYENMEVFCELDNLLWLQVDCGNGTSKDTPACATVCCNPEIKQCCHVGDFQNCFTTDPEAPDNF